MSVATTVTEIVEPLLRRSLGELGMVEGNAEAVTLVLPVLALSLIHI